MSTVLALSLALGAWLLTRENHQLRVREFELELPGWRSEHDGLRVALLSDPHVGSPWHGLPKLRTIVARINETHPDLILFLGDLIPGVVGGGRVPPEECAEVLADLRAPLGVFGVLGNHDWWWDGPRVAEALRQGGMTVLENDSTHLIIQGQPLWLAGIRDLWQNADLPETLRWIPAGDPVILLSHNPDVFPSVPERVSLTVSGHTHGGQVQLPLLGRPFIPSRYGARYAFGHIVEGGRHLFVTVGTGTSNVPLRFRTPPEIAVLTLRAPT